MTAIGAWPLNTIEHELRTLREYLRSQPGCPGEFRIRQIEGSFTRPMIDLSVTSAAVASDDRYWFVTTRGCSLIWWGGVDSEDDLAREAWNAAGWITEALARSYQDGTETGSIIRIKDWSTTPAEEVDAWMDIEPGSVSANPQKDAFGLWMVPVDFRYSVHRSAVMSGVVAVEDIDVEVIDP